MAEDLQYNTPQDRLLIMLLERISALEDKHDELRAEIKQSNENLAHIWAKSSSVYFGIVIEGKRETPTYTIAGVEHHPFGIRYEYLSTETINTVKKIIKDTFPQCTVSIQKESMYGPRAQVVNFYLEFDAPLLLDTIKDALEVKLLRYVSVRSWTTLSQFEMKTCFENHLFET